MAKTTKKRRSRTAHTGVKILKLNNGSWVARWIDPFTSSAAQQSMAKIGKTNADARRTWAIEKAAELKETKAKLASGHAVAERVTIAAAIKHYLAASTAKPNTLEGYMPSLKLLQQWASKSGVQFASDLQPRHLTMFRDHVVKLPITVPKAKAKRGATGTGNRQRAASTTRKTLTVIKGLLKKARQLGYTPFLDGDAIRERLEPVKEPKHAIEILRPPEVKELLEAALRHDAATFDLTRDEHDGLRPAGATPRHEPAAAFVLLGLLTGMRAEELIGLQWSEVDRDAGEIRLPASRVKTGHARTITLQETPFAIRLLQVLRLQTPGSRVFPEWTVDAAKNTRRRLTKNYGAPVFTLRVLRHSCCSILTCAPGIYGAASVFLSAKRAGHSVVIAEKHYLGVLRDLPHDATTLESAIGIEELAEQVVAQLGGTVEQMAAAQ